MILSADAENHLKEFSDFLFFKGGRNYLDITEAINVD